jgi:predicted MFS family arabinose efflux permease
MRTACGVRPAAHASAMRVVRHDIASGRSCAATHARADRCIGRDRGPDRDVAPSPIFFGSRHPAMSTATLATRGSADSRAFIVACGLALGPMVATGIGRFAYALILPAMREDLAWSYTEAGWMNTANALGYLIGALACLRLARSVDPRKSFAVGMVVTALMLIACGTTRQFGLLLALRLLTGVASALVFISGGALAAHVGSQRFAPTAIAVYFGGAGLGILLSGAMLPCLLERHGNAAWSLTWIAMGGVALACTLPSLLASASVEVPVDRHVAAQWSRRALACSFAGYFLHGVGYIAYMTFVVAWMKSRGSAALEVSIVWAILGAAAVASPLGWREPLRRWSGGASLAAAIAVLAFGAALPLLGGAFVPMALSAALVGSCVMVPAAATASLTRRCLPPAAVNSALATYTVLFSSGQSIGPVLTGSLADATGSLSGGLAFSVLVLAAAAWVASRQDDPD